MSMGLGFGENERQITGPPRLIYLTPCVSSMWFYTRHEKMFWGTIIHNKNEQHALLYKVTSVFHFLWGHTLNTYYRDFHQLNVVCDPKSHYNFCSSSCPLPTPEFTLWISEQPFYNNENNNKERIFLLNNLIREYSHKPTAVGRNK